MENNDLKYKITYCAIVIALVLAGCGIVSV